MKCGKEKVESRLPRWEVEYSGFENVTLGGESSIGLEVKALIPSPETKISFSGYEVCSESLVEFISNTGWQLDFDSTEVFPMAAALRVPSPGSYRISFKIETSDRRTNYEYEKGGTIYILVKNDSSIVVDTLPPDGFYPKTAPPPDSIIIDTIGPQGLLKKESPNSETGGPLALLSGDVTIMGTISYIDDIDYHPPEKLHLSGIRVCDFHFVPEGVYIYWTYADENGHYEFTNLPEGMHVIYVKAENNAAWMPNNDGYFENEGVGDVFSAGTYTIDITVRPPEWARILESLYYARKFCNNNFNWTPEKAIKVIYPADGTTYFYPFPWWNEIRIAEGDVWSIRGHYSAAHEYGHYVHDKRNGLSRFISGPDPHYRNSKSPPDFAFMEGWAEFYGEATCLYAYGNYYTDPEYFYQNGGNPYWKDGAEGEHCTHGDSVEGAVMQFHYDIYDGGINNDEGVDALKQKLWDVFSTNPHTISEFKVNWDYLAYPIIDEIYDVNIHPFAYDYNYPVPKPTNLAGGYISGKVHLSWWDNSINEGYFIIYRKASSGGFTKDDIITLLPPNTSLCTDEPSGLGGNYRYAVRALTCDTSAFSNDVEVWVPGIFTSYSGFEPNDPVPYENTDVYRHGVIDDTAKVVEAEQGVDPHQGQRMYKITGYDNEDDNTTYDDVGFKLYDCGIPITRPTFLSFWIFIKDTPEGEEGCGHITVHGYLKHGGQIKSWQTYGYIIDQTSQRINPELHNSPKDEWRQYVFSLYPAAGDTITSLIVAYESNPKSASGKFTAYIDDISITHDFPINNCWYAEVFGNGGPNNENSDPNFELRFDDQHWGVPNPWNPQGPYTRIKVDGHGLSTEPDCWIDSIPSLRLNIHPDVPITAYTNAKWCEYDLSPGVALSFLIKDKLNHCNWLTYSANAPEEWLTGPGWIVGLSGKLFNGSYSPSPCFDEWRLFEEPIYFDYLREYDAAPDYILETRLGHHCRSSQNGLTGGVISPPNFVQPNIFPLVVEVENFIVYVERSSGVDTMYDEEGNIIGIASSVWLEPVDIKTIVFKASVENPIGSGPPPDIGHANLFLSRDGGITFPETLAVNLQLRDSVKVETLSVNDTTKIRVTSYGTFQDTIPCTPSSDCQALLVVYDTLGNLAAATSASWEIPIVSTSPFATRGNSKLVSVENGEVHLVYTASGPTTSGPNPDTSHIYYLHTDDTKPWSSLERVGMGKSVSVDGDVALWLTNDGKGICRARRTGDSWSNTVLMNIPGGNPNINWRCSPPGFVVKNDMVYMAYEFQTIVNPPLIGVRSVRYRTFSLSNPLGYTEETITYRSASSGSQPIHAPVITLDYNRNPHVAWRYGDTCYYAFKDSTWCIESFCSASTDSASPSLVCYGGNKYLLYQNGNNLIRRCGYVDQAGWFSTDTIASAPGLANPDLIEGLGAVWQQSESDTNSVIMSSYWEPRTNTYSGAEQLSPTGIKASYPHGEVWQNSNETKLFAFWTDNNVQSGDGRACYRVAIKQDTFSSIEPYYYLELGREIVSPFTDYRDGFYIFDTRRVDYGEDSLGYEFSHFDLENSYEVLLELYVSGDSGVEWRANLELNDVEEEIAFNANEVTQIERPLPINPDGISRIKLTKLVGDYVPCARIIIYPAGSGSQMIAGGPQEIIDKKLPKVFGLYQNYPNPFRLTTTIKYQLPVETNVSLKIYDVMGRLVRRLVDTKQKPGYYTARWDGKAENGQKAASGVYFYRLETKEYKSTKKVVRLR